MEDPEVRSVTQPLDAEVQMGLVLKSSCLSLLDSH